MNPANNQNKLSMTFRYPKWLAYSRFGLAIAMSVILYATATPKWWGWLMFLPLFLIIVYEGMRSYRYALTVADGRISVAGFHPAQYAVADIADINVWITKGGRLAIIKFADQGQLEFSSHLVDFEKAVALLRTEANIPEPLPQP